MIAPLLADCRRLLTQPHMRYISATDFFSPIADSIASAARRRCYTSMRGALLRLLCAIYARHHDAQRRRARRCHAVDAAVIFDADAAIRRRLPFFEASRYAMLTILMRCYFFVYAAAALRMLRFFETSSYSAFRRRCFCSRLPFFILMPPMRRHTRHSAKALRSNRRR